MTKFHLGMFMNFNPPEWDGDWSSSDSEDWANGQFHTDVARALERAKFDFVMLEDTLMVPDAWGGSISGAVKHAIFAPKGDPVPLAVKIAEQTRDIGVVATMSTSFYPPYLLARLCSTVDSITGGRFGWNVVSSAEDRAAQNFGKDAIGAHDDRYDMTQEFFDVVDALWNSWEPGSVVMDRDSHVFADGSKIHTIDHDGAYFKSRGPLNTVPSPQRRPTILQAGASPRGREFAAGAADAIIAIGANVQEMKAYRDDVRARAEAAGRNPDDVKVMFVVSPIVAPTEAEARAEFERLVNTDAFVEKTLVTFSGLTEIDFSVFDWDEPLPADLTTNGELGSLKNFMRGDGTPGVKTLRELAINRGRRGVELIGTPAQVADRLAEVAEEIGGDGFLFTRPGWALNRRYINALCDGLVPELQRRGLAQTEYGTGTLRERLRAF